MFGWLYQALVRLHPIAFRERFGEEMIGIFGEARSNGMRVELLADAVASLGRQWALRPARREPVLSTSNGTPGTPVFQTLESDLPRRSALVNGALLSLILLTAVSIGIGRGGGNSRTLLIGAKYPRFNVLPVDRSSIEATEPTTEVKVQPAAVDPLYLLADMYFPLIPVLTALDANHDRILSAWEIVTASSPLARLDRDADGKLSPEECGFSPSATMDPPLVERAQMEFMRMNPVLATLDADRDGAISGLEIKNSATVLRRLDKNRDGSLTPAEVLPEVIDRRAAMILSRLDTNRDRILSRQERAIEKNEPMQTMLDRADRNGDGIISAAELTKELQFRDEMARQLRKAVGSAIVKVESR